MSSPFHSPDRSRSTPRSSPSRQRLSDSRRVGQINGFHRPYRESPQRESPSRPLWEEFERLYVREENNFRQSLDAQDAEQERLHKQQLREALEQHEAVRQSAERARERLELEIKKESQRREEEEKRAVEEARRKLAEQEEAARRRQIEENKQREEERKRREALQREKEEQERQIAARKLREEQEKLQREAARQREEAECKSREYAIAKEQAQTQKPEPLPIQQSQHHQSNGITAAPAHSAASAPTGLTPGVSGGTMQGLVTTASEREGVHKRYVGLHQRLKVMRKSIVDECKRREFKQLGDWRREIRVNCGQLNKLNKDSNRINTTKVRKILNDAKGIAEPSINITEYLVLAHDKAPGSIEGVNTRYPGVLFYLLNILAKSAISQLISETGIDTETGDALGVLICSIFSVPDFRWNEQSLIDIFWAKYHVVCPPLFGIFGSESSEGGKSRLGWWIDRDYNDDGEKLSTGARVSDDMHYQRMTGLGVGFSAITLRDFSKSRNRNPTPNRLWWESMARLLNTPANEVQSTHYVLVKALIEESMPRITSIYGGAGKAVVRRAILDFPKIGPKTQPKRSGELPRLKPAVVALESMKLTMQQKYGITV